MFQWDVTWEPTGEHLARVNKIIQDAELERQRQAQYKGKKKAEKDWSDSAQLDRQGLQDSSSSTVVESA